MAAQGLARRFISDANQRHTVLQQVASQQSDSLWAEFVHRCDGHVDDEAMSQIYAALTNAADSHAAGDMAGHAPVYRDDHLYQPRTQLPAQQQPPWPAPAPAPPADFVICPVCTFHNELSALRCAVCTSSLDEVVSQERRDDGGCPMPPHRIPQPSVPTSISCPRCTLENDIWASTCSLCEVPLPQPPQNGYYYHHGGGNGGAGRQQEFYHSSPSGGLVASPFYSDAVSPAMQPPSVPLSVNLYNADEFATQQDALRAQQWEDMASAHTNQPHRAEVVEQMAAASGAAGATAQRAAQGRIIRIPKPAKTLPHSVVWEKDTARPDCRVCQKAFGMLLWRHHCRICGCLVCNDCCYDLPIVHGGNTHVLRHCAICADVVDAPVDELVEQQHTITAHLEETNDEPAGGGSIQISGGPKSSEGSKPSPRHLSPSAPTVPLPPPSLTPSATAVGLGAVREGSTSGADVADLAGELERLGFAKTGCEDGQQPTSALAMHFTEEKKHTVMDTHNQLKVSPASAAYQPSTAIQDPQTSNAQTSNGSAPSAARAVLEHGDKAGDGGEEEVDTNAPPCPVCVIQPPSQSGFGKAVHVPLPTATQAQQHPAPTPLGQTHSSSLGRFGRRSMGNLTEDKQEQTAPASFEMTTFGGPESFSDEEDLH